MSIQSRLTDSVAKIQIGPVLFWVVLILWAPTLVHADQGYTLYGYDFNNGGNLVTIDVETGTVETVGPVGFTIRGIAFDVSTGTLFGIELSGTSPNRTHSIVSIDRATGAGTRTGPELPYFSNAGMAYVPSTDFLYVVPSINAFETDDPLIRIDSASGVGTVIGETGSDNLSALTFDSSTQTLYGIGSPSGSTDEYLMSIDIETGASTLIGSTSGLSSGPWSIFGLAYDPYNERLIGSNLEDMFNSNELVEINKVTGEATSLGFSGPFPGITSLTFVPNTIPEPGSLALFGVGGCLFAARLRYRRPALPKQ